MPRRPRISSGELVYHVLNRAVGRRRIFFAAADYDAFGRCIDHAYAQVPVPVLTFCLMPNHWHLMLSPRGDGDLSEFMRLLTVTHTQRYHAAHHTSGEGPLYQGRFKSFPVQCDRHTLIACRYVERNAVRAGLSRRAIDWAWCGAARRKSAPTWLLPFDRWPVLVPDDWAKWVDQTATAAEEAALQQSLRRGRPFGSDVWIKRTAKRLDLESTLRPRGRPWPKSGRD